VVLISLAATSRDPAPVGIGGLPRRGFLAIDGFRFVGVLVTAAGTALMPVLVAFVSGHSLAILLITLVRGILLDVALAILLRQI
jgi:hypothetical protein